MPCKKRFASAFADGGYDFTVAEVDAQRIRPVAVRRVPVNAPHT